MNFVDQFLQHTRHYESPTSFWRWSAYTTIAAILRDNCYRRFGDKRTYPNIYTLLLASSAVQRKGEPVRLCETLVRTVKNTKVISGRSSIQAILDELSRGETDKKTGVLLKGGSALFSARELAAGLVNDVEAVNILTDIYDFDPMYISRLRGAGTFRIENLCFTMLAASNEELLTGVYDKKAVFGGLLGRTFLVKPSEFRPGNSLFTINDTSTSFQLMIEHLQKVAQVKGEFEFTESSQMIYNDWYLPFRKSYESRPDKSGISGRIHTSIIKLAMILAADRLSLVIDDCDIQEAIVQCLSLLPNYNQFVMTSGKSTVAEIAAIFIEEIWRSKDRCITQRDFMTKHFHEFDMEIFEKCTSTLAGAELIKTCMYDGTLGYVVTDKCKEVFKLTEEK